MTTTMAPADPLVRAMTPADDAAVRALLRRSVMPGAIRLALTREPEYLAGAGLLGAEEHTVVVPQGERIAGIGRLTIRTLHRNGQRQRIGYLGELRLDPGTPRAPTLIRAGFEQLRPQLATLDACVTSVAADNTRARTVLESGTRFGLPHYEPLRTLTTVALPVPRRLARVADTELDPAAAWALIAARAPTAHLTLPWDDALHATFGAHGISPNALVVAGTTGDVAGCGLLWDQRRFRQVVIDGYDTTLARLRPVLNAGAWLVGRPGVPAVGAVLAQAAMLGATVVTPDAWQLLWPALARAARQRGIDWLTVTRESDDPEMATLRRLPGAMEYRTQLYAVHWPGATPAEPWSALPMRPEVGLL